MLNEKLYKSTQSYQAENPSHVHAAPTHFTSFSHSLWVVQSGAKKGGMSQSLRLKKKFYSQEEKNLVIHPLKLMAFEVKVIFIMRPSSDGGRCFGKSITHLTGRQHASLYSHSSNLIAQKGKKWSVMLSWKQKKKILSISSQGGPSMVVPLGRLPLEAVDAFDIRLLAGFSLMVR